MNVVVRADGSEALGNGHIFRTLKLAEELRKRGHNVSYICSDLPGAPLYKIRENEFQVKIINEKEDDTRQVVNWALTKGAKWLIVDRYASHREEYECYKLMGLSVLAIDDVCETEFPVDILVNQNLYADQLDYVTESYTIKLLGPKYVMMDEVYFETPKIYAPVPPLKFFVFMGGDLNNTTMMAAKSLLRLHVPCRITIVINSTYKHQKELQDYVSANARLYHSVDIFRNLPNLKSAASGSFLALIAGGMTVYEMCAMAIPFAIIPSNLNQMLVSAYHDKMGSGINLGMAQKLTEDHLFEVVYSLVEDGIHDLLSMSKVGASFVKENGVSLIVDEMERIKS